MSTNPESATRNRNEFAIAVAVYCIAAIAFTWPLALHPSSLLGAPVGPGDPYLYVWTLGWGMQTFLAHPAWVFTGRVFDANIFHPAAGTLTYSDHLLLQSALLTPVYAATHDAVLCYNLVLFVSLVAGAVAMHWFIRRTLETTGGAYVAGLAWGFGSFHFAHLLHLQLQALYFLPLTFLFLHRLFAGARWRDAIVLGVLVALQAIASVYYAVIGGLALVIGAIVFLLSGPLRVGIVSRLAVAAGIAAMLVLPLGVVYWRVQQDEGFGRNLYEASHGAAFLDSYLQVPPGNLLYGWTGLLRRAPDPPRAEFPHTGPERELFPGVAIVLLALIGAWFGARGPRRRLVVAMCAIGALGFVLSLGPDGVRPIYAALHRYVFGFQAIRAPARFSVLVTFALATLGAIGWCELAARVRGQRAARYAGFIALACVALECAHVPRALAAAPPLTTDVGQWLAHAPGTGAVVVLPLTLDIENTPAMIQSLEHRRPIVNGYSGQRPSFYPELVDTLSTFPSGESLLALHEIGVQYVVVPAGARELPDEGGALAPRASLAGGSIYELLWTPQIEARLAHLTTVVPPQPGRIPFAVGEHLRYEAKWDGAGIDVPAGEITLAVEPPRYRFVVTAATAPWVARFFEAQDRFATTTDARLLPLVHERDQHEGSRRTTRAFVYDQAASRIRSGRTVDEARSAAAVTLPLPQASRDAISAFYYVRTLPMVPGFEVEIPVNEAGKNVVIDLRVAGRDTIVTGGRAVPALRLEPRLQERVQRQAVAATVWVSADERRIPVKVELAAPFGHLTLQLASYQAGL